MCVALQLISNVIAQEYAVEWRNFYNAELYKLYVSF